MPKVDFSQVEDRVLIDEGVYLLKVNKITEEVSDSGNDYLKWVFQVIGGDNYDKTLMKGVKLYHNTSLLPRALWNLRNLLTAMGVTVPKGVLDLRLKSYLGKQVWAEVTHETYQGKERAAIAGFVDEVQEVVGEEEEEVDMEEEAEE